MRVLKSIAVYFALVFGAGFILGSIRVPFLVPKLGERGAELLEAPCMVIAIVLAGRWVARRFLGSDRALLLVGLAAAMLVITADLLVGMSLRGMSLAQTLFGRDPVSGTVYYILLSLFACMPWMCRRGMKSEQQMKAHTARRVL